MSLTLRVPILARHHLWDLDFLACPARKRNLQAEAATGLHKNITSRTTDCYESGVLAPFAFACCTVTPGILLSFSLFHVAAMPAFEVS